jgi:hypothetical protein
MMQEAVATAPLLRCIWRGFGEEQFCISGGFDENAMLVAELKVEDQVSSDMRSFMVPAIVARGAVV